MPEFEVSVEKTYTQTGKIKITADTVEKAVYAVKAMMYDKDKPLQTNDDRIEWDEPEHWFSAFLKNPVEYIERHTMKDLGVAEDKKMDSLFFTITQPSDGHEVKLNVEYDDIGGHDGVEAGPVKITLSSDRDDYDFSVEVSPQQLTEIAALFLALAGTTVDYSGADALLEGYGLKGKQAAKKLASELEE
jgi:hypothetical protein